MRDFFETVVLVLDWRLRSMWMLIAFLIATTIFGYVTDSALEKFIETGGVNGTGLYNAFQPVFESAFYLFLILSFVVPFGVFIKDWVAFHNRRW